MREGEREGPTRRRKRREIRSKKEEERRTLSYVTPTGVTALHRHSPLTSSSPYGGLTSLLEIQIPREMVVILSTALCSLSHAYASSISLIVLRYVPLVLYSGSRSFALISSHSSSTLSLSLSFIPSFLFVFVFPYNCSDAFKVSRIILTNSSRVYFIITMRVRILKS